MPISIREQGLAWRGKPIIWRSLHTLDARGKLNLYVLLLLSQIKQSYCLRHDNNYIHAIMQSYLQNVSQTMLETLYIAYWWAVVKQLSIALIDKAQSSEKYSPEI